MLKHTLLLAAAFAAITSVAQAGDNDDPPILFHGPGMAVIMKSTARDIDVVTGDNPLDKVRAFVCKSTAGCVVIMSASLTRVNTLGTKTCSFVHGVAGNPGFPSGRNDLALVVTRTQRVVTQGTHSIQTIVHADNTQGRIQGWAV